MKTKEIITVTIALLAFFVFLVVAPVCAKDASKCAELKETAAKATDTVKSDTEKATAEATKAATTGKININNADLETLANLKGIGPKTAQNIIDYRKEVGSFEKVEDLMNVKGVGEKTLEAIKPFIKLK